MAHTDVHCHILPGVDDGPSGLDEALHMARVAADDGVETIVVTPHGHMINKPGTPALQEHIDTFRGHLETQGVRLRLLPGAEYRLLPNLPSLVDQREAVTLNGSRYLLVELDPMLLPDYLFEVLFQLRLREIVPVLAHPERQAAIQRQPKLVREIADKGVPLQVTASSLTGGFGPQARKTAEALLREGMVSFVATDAHQEHGHRKPVVSPALGVIQSLTDPTTAQLLSEHNPQAVLENLVLKAPSIPAQRGRLWSRMVPGLFR